MASKNGKKEEKPIAPPISKAETNGHMPPSTEEEPERREQFAGLDKMFTRPSFGGGQTTGIARDLIDYPDNPNQMWARSIMSERERKNYLQIVANRERFRGRVNMHKLIAIDLNSRLSVDGIARWQAIADDIGTMPRQAAEMLKRNAGNIQVNQGQGPASS